jgi:hypothetical protein
MTASPTPKLFQALLAFSRAIPALDGPVMVIGGIAAIARGVPRQTVDIDATIDGDGVDLERMVHTLASFEIVPRIPNAVEFARQHLVLLLEHAPTSTGIDLSLGWLPFEREAIARATPVEIASAVLPVAQLADLVVLKAIAWRDRDRGDIERLLRAHGNELDLDWIRSAVLHFYHLLEEPERIAEFDVLVRKVLADADDIR